MQAALRKSFDRFMHGSPEPGRSANALAEDCLGVTELMRAGAPDGMARLRTLVDALLAKVLHRASGVLAWGPNSSPAMETECGKGGIKAFGHCNPGDTAYSVQSGLAIACLSEAADLLHDPSLVERARSALHYWDAHSAKVAGCGNCIYYWYDDDRADVKRYVRNINVIMGFGAASLAARHGDAVARSLAEATYNADKWELQRGNHGYLGRLDPQWVARRSEATRIEYHAPFVALFAARIRADLSLRDLGRHGHAVWREWATCDNAACRADDCHGVTPTRTVVFRLKLSFTARSDELIPRQLRCVTRY